MVGSVVNLMKKVIGEVVPILLCPIIAEGL